MQCAKIDFSLKKHKFISIPKKSPRITRDTLIQMIDQWDLGNSATRIPVAIFDLDGTLFNNFPRQIAIFGQILRPLFPELWNVLETTFEIDEMDQPYSILSLIQNDIPSETQKRQIKQTFIEAFLSNKFLRYDKTYSGAREVLHFCIQRGFRIVFLTGRPFETMYQGTIESIEAAGFPSPRQPEYQENVRLIMKPEITMDDFAFKNNIFSEFNENSKEQIAFFFDNEATACNMAKNSFPNATVIHFLSNQSDTTDFQGPELCTW